MIFRLRLGPSEPLLIGLFITRPFLRIGLRRRLDLFGAQAALSHERPERPLTNLKSFFIINLSSTEFPYYTEAHFSLYCSLFLGTIFPRSLLVKHPRQAIRRMRGGGKTKRDLFQLRVGAGLVPNHRFLKSLTRLGHSAPKPPTISTYHHKLQAHTFLSSFPPPARPPAQILALSLASNSSTRSQR
jgi:hypothetical protein